MKVLGIPIRVAGASHGNLNYLVNLAVCLKKYGKNWEPAVLTSLNMLPAGSREVLERCGAAIIDMPHFAKRPTASGFARALVGNDPEVRAAATRAKLDCIFENATFYGRHCGIPVLHWIPDLQHRELPEMFPRVARLRRELLIRCVLMGGRTILMSSADARDAMLKYYAPDAKCLYIARFASALIGDECPPGPATELADLGIAKPFAFVPNQFWRHKNHLILPRAAKLVSERGISLNFVCTGVQSDPRSREYFAEFDRLVGECNVRDRFVTPGLVPYARVRSLHQQSAMLINPSFVEGWNTGVEEAKFLGARLVLSDIGTHREQVLNYSRARLFDPHSHVSLADAICETLGAGVVSQKEILTASAAYGKDIRDFVDAVELALSQAT